MNYRQLAFLTVSTLLAGTATVSATERGSLELIDNLTVCSGRLAGAKGFESYVDGLSTARLSSLGALEYLLGSGRLRPDRRQAINNFRGEFEQQLMASPAKAKILVANLYSECMQYVYDAEDVRLADIEADKEEKKQLLKAEREEKKRQEREEQRELALINAELVKDTNRTELEKAKINSQTTLSLVEKAADVENARTRADVEIAGKNAEVEISKTTANVDIAKINADATIQIVGKRAEIENGKTKAGVEKSRISANAAMAIADKAAQIEADRNAADVAVAQIQADANVEATKSAVGVRFAIDGKGATIQEIGLGFGAESCPTTLQPVKISARFAGKNAPSSVVSTCVFGDTLDETTVFYDGDAHRVVRVQRDIWMNSSEVGVEDVMAEARKFYGEGAVPADNGRSLIYIAEPDAGGQSPSKPTYGLKIRKYLCDQKECEAKDGNNVLFTFNLIDIPGFAKAVKDGARGQEEAQGDTTKAIRF